MTELKLISGNADSPAAGTASHQTPAAAATGRVTEARRKNILERLILHDLILARRFNKLHGAALEIAVEGILRHMKACERMDMLFDMGAVREIIEDAVQGRKIYAMEVE